ncbi:MAG TPA: methyltransferase, TIGR04325 family [Candidatus Wunengus sp. YC61]|uniref:methyltransferase, TIGR04325 family n=1 Tax=Candidatus Wunengus sp. YC61 TaxID=3367698 RepID=UPI004024BAE8
MSIQTPHFRGIFLGESSLPPISDDNLFNNHLWLESVEWYLRNDYSYCHRPDFWIEPYLREIITLIVAKCYSSTGTVKVLDFGGGIGNTYVPIAAKIPNHLNYDYHIIDTPSHCQRGREIFRNDERISFSEALEHDGSVFTVQENSYDIVMVSSTLQYIRNWKCLLGKLFDLNNDFFVLTRFSTGEMPTFTTIQSIVMSYGPHKGKYVGDIYHTFINRNELINFLLQHGYEICFDIFYADYRENLRLLPEPFCNACLRTMIFKKGANASKE